MCLYRAEYVTYSTAELERDDAERLAPIIRAKIDMMSLDEQEELVIRRLWYRLDYMSDDAYQACVAHPVEMMELIRDIYSTIGRLLNRSELHRTDAVLKIMHDIERLDRYAHGMSCEYVSCCDPRYGRSTAAERNY
jgi:hypothetical protein